ncbi:hypothetical protein B0H15DRAFT_834048 [Mycena belliarum]|uniref:Uncharacterized protein n=1 Tax=Mycena belliarum TaxID=1033014 RepID=A0AAD6UBE1_9AGAR|nr:hypothetical protein B0H15DRAFT_834048 [Mycena belliae]
MYSSARNAPHVQTARFTGNLTGHPTARSTGASNPFNTRFNEVASQLGVPVSSNEELDELLSPFAKNPTQLAALKAKVIKAAEANVPAFGRFPVLGETPEESGRPAFQILRLPERSGLSVRFFCGASPPGMLFFDFVDARTGLPMNLPTGYSVHQRMPEQDIQLIPLHEVFGSFPMDAKAQARFALREGTEVVLCMPKQQEHHFQSPIIPLADREYF